MKKKLFAAMSLLSFLLVFSSLTPVVVNSWANPLATDPTGDAPYNGEDILSVDAQSTNGFIYFRFKMDDPIIEWMAYLVLMDFDKNISTDGGGIWVDSDIGTDVRLACYVGISTDITAQVDLRIYGSTDTNEYVIYNMTANNGTVMSWSDLTVVPYFDLLIFTNGSQGDVAFGVNLAWLITEAALVGISGNGNSMYLEFRSEWDTDWCPDRTGGTTDYIEWTYVGNGSIPGFSGALVFICLLSVLAAMVLLDRKRVKF